MKNKLLIEFFQNVEKIEDNLNTNPKIEYMLKIYEDILNKSDEEKKNVLLNMVKNNKEYKYAALIAIIDSTYNITTHDKELILYKKILAHIKIINRIFRKVKSYVPINIWDDFYEDGYVPEGKIQQTYAYVEDDKLTPEQCKEYLTVLANFITNNNLISNPNTEVIVAWHDTANDYTPEQVAKCTEMYGESFFFKRWEIQFNNFTHSDLNTVLKSLNDETLLYNEALLEIYSES